ncbi:MAG: hypothetical protein KC619_25215 [Myxococcales bacterium]|nr:hypothetical protein [Myxococcales bacterium]
MGGTPKLIELAPDLASRVPAVDDEALVLRAEDLPAPPTEIDAPNLVAQVVRHTYHPSYAVQGVDFFGSRRAYRALALLTLSQLLHRGPRHVRVRLAPPDVFPREETSRHVPELLLLELPREIDPSASDPGLALTVDRFTYAPRVPARHPFPSAAADVWSLPSIHLTDSKGMGEDRVEEQIAVLGFGSLEGVAQMVELLLDISQPASTRLRFDLECEAGYRGVAPASHEMRLLLPGDDAWLPKPGFADGPG